MKCCNGCVVEYAVATAALACCVMPRRPATQVQQCGAVRPGTRTGCNTNQLSASGCGGGGALTASPCGAACGGSCVCLLPAAPPCQCVCICHAAEQHSIRGTERCASGQCRNVVTPRHECTLVTNAVHGFALIRTERSNGVHILGCMCTAGSGCRSPWRGDVWHGE